MMLKTLRDRFLALGEGEDGVAMVVTLGIFMFMYVACASVYAVGMAVKEKMQLQAACDAAAYSAAVVQADAFSRIATINRAMGWTYAQMTKRQADYIMWKWLDGVQRSYDETVRYLIRTQPGNGGRHGHLHWYVGEPDSSPEEVASDWQLGDKDRVKLNGGPVVNVQNGFESVVGRKGDLVGRHLSQESASFYADNLPGHGSIERLRRQLDKDRLNIVRMNDSLVDILTRLPGHIRQAVSGTLRANVPAHLRDQCCVRMQMPDDRNPGEGIPYDDCFELMTSEKRLVYWGGASLGTAEDLVWLPRSDGRICRSYRQVSYRRDSYRQDSYRQDGRLVAEWEWAPYVWKCSVNGVCTGTRADLSTPQYQGEHARDEYFTGVEARPLQLKQEYFGPNGTITVALARRSANPFAPLLGAQPSGIYSAFNPIADAWTFCLASAKAGYKLTDGQEDWEVRHNGKAVDYNGNQWWHPDFDPRAYCIDWKPTRLLRHHWVRPRYDSKGRLVEKGHWEYAEDRWRQSWNLIQSDWDAVMLPVRQGGGSAFEIQHFRSARAWRANISRHPYNFEPVWDNATRVQNFVSTVVSGSGWESLDGGYSSLTPNVSVLAGPTDGDAGDPLNGQLAGQLWESHWRKGSPPPTASGTGLWNIGKPGKSLDWAQIGDQMYH